MNVERPGNIEVEWPAARNARSRLRPRLPRPKTKSRSGVLAGGRAGGRRLRRSARENLVQLAAVERLHHLELLHHYVHLVTLLGEDRLRSLVAVVDDAPDLLVDDRGGLLP